jgi:hypothetical protein
MKVLAVGFCIGVAVGIGFITVTNTSTASREADFRDELRGLIQGVSSESARVLDDKLQDIRSNEIHTERLIHTEIIKPVFTHICATDEYVRLFNDSVERDERTLSGKPADDVPGKAATSGGKNGK